MEELSFLLYDCIILLVVTLLQIIDLLFVCAGNNGGVDLYDGLLIRYFILFLCLFLLLLLQFFVLLFPFFFLAFLLENILEEIRSLHSELFGQLPLHILYFLLYVVVGTLFLANEHHVGKIKWYKIVNLVHDSSVVTQLKPTFETVRNLRKDEHSIQVNLLILHRILN